LIRNAARLPEGRRPRARDVPAAERSMSATPESVFARRVFRAAGIYGLIVLLPMYFLENRLGVETPPPITHPEYYYGFAGVAVAWQLAFLVIANDPARFRPMMPPAVIEKATYGFAVLALFAAGRIAPMILVTGVVDLLLGALFLAAYLRGAPGRRSRSLP
jgi:hypothetical protein